MSGKAPVSAGGKQGGRFRPGQSGNPSGRAPGTRNKITLAAEALLDGEVEALTRKAIELALEGDVVALRLCLDRVVPPRKGRAVTFALPAQLKTASDLARAQEAILAAMARGELTTEEAADAARVLEAFGASLERRELEARIAELQARLDGQEGMP